MSRYALHVALHRSTYLRMSLQLVQDGVFAKLKHQMKATLPPEHLQQADQVRVLQVLQQAYLPQRDLAYGRIVLRLDEALDRDERPRLAVPALVHHPVRSFAEPAELLVPVHPTAAARSGKQGRQDEHAAVSEGAGKWWVSRRPLSRPIVPRMMG